MAVPMKSDPAKWFCPGKSSGAQISKPWASNIPRARGNSTPTRDTRVARGIRPRKCSGFSSMPIKNMNKISPNWESKFSCSSTGGANSTAWLPGHIQPSNEGPSKMPPIISPITGGWPRPRTSRPSSFVTTMISATSTSTVERMLNPVTGVGAIARGAMGSASHPFNAVFHFLVDLL